MALVARGRAALVILLAALGLATAFSACDSSTPVTYAPAAYGQQFGNIYDCYYVDDPGEVTSLIAAGLCPHNSYAMLAPVTWRERYWSYYSSPAYYNTYIPTKYRSVYVSRTVPSFSRQYSSQIKQAQSTAVYKSSTGKTVKGGSASLKYNSGTSSSNVHGGGARGCAESLTVVQMRGGVSSGSHGGGSRGSIGRSSGSGSRGSGC